MPKQKGAEKRKQTSPSLGKLIDRMYLIREKIREVEKVIKELKRKKSRLEVRALRKFEKDDIDGCRGKLGQARINTTPFPSIKDRRKFDRYVRKHNAFDLFQNRINSKAYKARVEEGEEVPGVNVFERVSISIRKRGKK